MIMMVSPGGTKLIAFMTFVLFVKPIFCFCPLPSKQFLKTSSIDRLTKTDPNVGGIKSLSTMMTIVDFKGPGLAFNPVVTSAKSSFDSKSIGGPVIQRYVDEEAEEEKWIMFYHGRSLEFDQDVLQLSTGRIGRATSKDGITWTKDVGSDFSENESILDVNTENWWTFDTAHVGLGDVIVGNSDIIRSADTMYYMYYFGGSFEEVNLETYGLKNPAAVGKAGIRTRIGVAVSNDGINWGRVEGEHPTGCIVDVGKEDEFDSLYLHSPQVVSTGSELFRMYYHSLDPATKKNTVGLAISRDGMRFEKRGPVFTGGPAGSFDEFGASRRYVLFAKELNAYFMFYEALDGKNQHSIGLAVSKDGFEWERFSDEPIFKPSDSQKGHWDSGHVGSPYIVNMGNGVYRMYYVGSPKRTDASGSVPSAIGVAECNTGDLTTWKRVAS